jgi:hypothetical protein
MFPMVPLLPDSAPRTVFTPWEISLRIVPQCALLLIHVPFYILTWPWSMHRVALVMLAMVSAGALTRIWDRAALAPIAATE